MNHSMSGYFQHDRDALRGRPASTSEMRAREMRARVSSNSDREIDDKTALNLIEGMLAAQWSTDTLDMIADIVRLTGRTVADENPGEVNR